MGLACKVLVTEGVPMFRSFADVVLFALLFIQNISSFLIGFQSQANSSYPAKTDQIWNTLLLLDE